MSDGSRRDGGLCENALIEYGDAPNAHLPDRREIKALIWCKNPAEFKVSGVNIPRASFYCSPCTDDILKSRAARGLPAMPVEKIGA